MSMARKHKNLKMEFWEIVVFIPRVFSRAQSVFWLLFTQIGN